MSDTRVSRARSAASLAKLFAKYPNQVRNLPRFGRSVGRSPFELRQPWLAFDVVDWLIQRLPPNARVFEFGGGGSTAWFADRGAQIVSVEHDESWAAVLRQELGSSPNVTLVEAGVGQDAFATYVSTIDAYSDNHFDLIVVDGRERVRCVERSIPKVKPGGIILLDDSERARYADARDRLADWPRHEFHGLTPGKFNAGHTTLWIKP